MKSAEEDKKMEKEQFIAIDLNDLMEDFREK
jgi:hypothetical protein